MNNNLPSKKTFLFTLTAAFFLLYGCQTIKQFIPNDEVARFGTDRKYPDLNYTGDGNFMDYGRKAGIFRFVLDLGGFFFRGRREVPNNCSHSEIDSRFFEFLERVAINSK